MRLVITGPPAAGKGSLAPFIVKEYNIKHISTGQLFRQEIASGSKLGKEIATIISEGHLVSDDYTNKLVEQRLLQDDVKDGFLLDGYPRTLNQAIFLDEFLASQGVALDHVISLEIDEPTLIKRIVGRRVCPKCGRNYNIYFTNSKVDGICDDDGTALVERADDTEEVVRERLRVYMDQTKPVIRYYDERGKLLRACGSHLRSADTFKEVQEKIGVNK